MLRRLALVGLVFASGCAENGPESSVAPLPSALMPAVQGAVQPQFPPNRMVAPATTAPTRRVDPEDDPFEEPRAPTETPPRGDVEL